MTADELRPLLGFHTTIAEMKRLCATLANLPDDVVFFALFPLATIVSPVSADPLAATLLVDLDPACPLTCEEAVRAMTSNLWQVSDGFVPFYLLNSSVASRCSALSRWYVRNKHNKNRGIERR